MQSSEIDAEVSIAFEKVWGQLTTHQRVDINAITSQLVGKTYNEENMHVLQSDFALTPANSMLHEIWWGSGGEGQGSSAQDNAWIFYSLFRQFTVMVEFSSFLSKNPKHRGKLHAQPKPLGQPLSRILQESLLLVLQALSPGSCLGFRFRAGYEKIKEVPGR